MGMIKVTTLKQAEQNRLLYDLRHAVKFFNESTTVRDFKIALRLVMKYGHYRLSSADRLTVYLRVSSHLIEQFKTEYNK